MPQHQPEPEEISVDVRGARVNLLRAGSGRPLILVHGLVGSSTNWRRNIAALAAHSTVYAIDQLNMGRSQRVADLDASLEATARRIVDCMDALGIAEADVAGHSHGGAVSLMLAARHPERVRSLILYAPANPFSRLSDLLIRLYNSAPGRCFAHLVPHLPSSLHRFALGRMYGSPKRIPHGCLEGYTEGLSVAGTIPHILKIVHGWHSEMARLEAALPLVASTPTLLLWGDRDRAVDPASAQTLHKILTRSELHIVPDAGHVLFEEFPAESNRLMLDWLSRDLTSLSVDFVAPSLSASRLHARQLATTLRIQSIS